jgi:hypothetical protein
MSDNSNKTEPLKVVLGCKYIRPEGHEFVTEWGYSVYPEGGFPDERDEKNLFKSGDLVKVFNTISEGEVLWEGKIKLNRDSNRHTSITGFESQAIDAFRVKGIQEDTDPLLWLDMFLTELPAVLKKDGRTIHGSLEACAETGTEGIIWAVSEFGKSSYDGLHALEDSDELTVYSSVPDGEVDWEGEVQFHEPDGPTDLCYNKVKRLPLHMDEKRWYDMCIDRRPAIITPAP